MRFITISGPARSGKDYIANLLSNKLNCKTYALADILKEYLCVVFNITLEELNEFKNDSTAYTKNGTTMREILQRFGTEIFVNKVDKLYWCKKLKEKILNDNVDYAIITDVRFIHEIEFFENSFKIKILGNECINENNHISERSLDNYEKYDFIIDNKDKKDLTEIINSCIFKIKKGLNNEI